MKWDRKRSGRPRTERWRIALSKGVIGLLLVVFLVGGNRWERHYPLVADLFFVVGITLVGFATAGRIWCSLYISGRKTKSLVTLGPYSMCRNPLYFFSFIGCAGIGLTTETLLLPLAALIAFAVYYPSVIAAEEGRLLEAHGDAFREYQRTTPRFLPSFSRLREAEEEYPVHAKRFRSGMIDAMCFVWAVGLIELAEGLHGAGILPSWIPLW
ncbi:MAG: hypothetical protein QOF78_688 [Phycisphaerales bacterium]|jgi:protein-S-isoprenylcysteine O-methyltransferase Ste14|nr:hypothetical protein [Phycisphaerales bacterium]